MTLDTFDLRAVLGEHVATLTHVPDFAASAAVRGRRTQRRRTAAGIGAIAIVVAGILGVTQLIDDPHRAAVPATPKGFATYSHGMKLVKARQGSSPLDFEVTMPATADGKPLAVGVSLSCASPSARDSVNNEAPSVNLSMDGEQQGAVTGCHKAFPTSSAVTISWDLKDKSFAAGSTHRIHVDLSGDVPPNTQLRVGVYASVPLDQYVFPPAPAHVTPVTRSQMSPDGKVLATVKAGGPTSVTVRPRKGLEFDTSTSEPGQLKILVNGKLVKTVSSWTYDESGDFGDAYSLKQLGLKPDEAARITVIPDRYTGRTWLIAVTDRAHP